MNDDDGRTFPNFAGKHEQASMFTPQDFFDYLRKEGRLPDITVPKSVIMCYSPWLIKQAARMEGSVAAVSPTAGSFQLLSDGRVGVVGGFGIGAPAAASVMEELIACGATRFISIGAAGCLQSHVKEGDVILCTSAIRDEGVSHHYSPLSGPAIPSERLTNQMKAVLERSGLPFIEGSAWTIDAPYRETVAEARHYQEQGVVAVEMEAAALFTVAAYRSVDVAAAFVVSDSLAEMTWQPRFGTSEVREAMLRLFEVAVTVSTEGSS